MSTPLQLTTDEMDLVLALASPIAYRQRDEFLRQVAEALASWPERGPGTTHRIARQVQRGFVLEARREAETGAGVPTHSRSAQREARAGR
jgi:hypothetical protein